MIQDANDNRTPYKPRLFVLSRRYWVLLATLLAAVTASATTPAYEAEREWLVDGRWSIYVGRHTDTRFVDIIQGDTNFQDSYLATLMYTVQVADWPPHAQWDAETGVTRHWGQQQHGEVNAAIMLRAIPWPYAQRWRATVGMGIGPSWASRTPEIERARGGRTSRRLLFMPFELTLGPANQSSAVFARVHHRSGGFDVFSRGRGSNFVAIGARYVW